MWPGDRRGGAGAAGEQTHPVIPSRPGGAVQTGQEDERERQVLKDWKQQRQATVTRHACGSHHGGQSRCGRRKKRVCVRRVCSRADTCKSKFTRKMNIR